MTFLRIVALACAPISLSLSACATATGPGGSGSGSGGGSASASSGSSSASGDAGTCDSTAECAAMNDACNAGVCVNGVCVKGPANEGSSCDDGLFCTENDFCKSGVCVGGTTRYCTPPDACHIGACDEATDSCTSTPGNDGAQCDDMDPCTLAGTCQGGACAKGLPVDCSVLNDVCGVGVCDPMLGCTKQPKNDGTPCDDGLYCTIGDQCQGGTCKGQPNTCAAPGDVCMVGMCNEAQKTCVAVPGNDGAPCDDKNVCTTGETCSAGKCVGGVAANNGMACDDGNGCTAGTTCAAGQCTNPMSQIMACASNDQCCPAGCSIGNDNDCAFQFKLSQVIDGVTVTCSSVNNTALYTECDDLLANGLYFPNGVSCGPMWSSQPSPYTDLQGFCQSLTNSAQFEVYYTCDFTKPRTTWKAHMWGTTMDNGYTQHVRCYY